MFHLSPSSWIRGFIVVVALALPALAGADIYYTAILDGPTAGSPSLATGTAVFTLNSAETEVAYVIEYSELEGTETVAHIHNAPPGVIGPVFHDLEYGSPKIGVWEVGPFEVEELNAGRVNILIHSDPYFGGEIRGNLEYHSIAGDQTQAGEVAPANLVLRANYPNPFNPVTTIRYGVPSEGRVSLAIYDARGRLVKNLLNEVQPAGFHEVVWNGTDSAGAQVASGVYLYRVVTGDRARMKKMLLMK